MPIEVAIKIGDTNNRFGRELLISRVSELPVEGGGILCEYKVEVVTQNKLVPYYGKWATFNHWYDDDVYTLTAKAIAALKKVNPEVGRW